MTGDTYSWQRLKYLSVVESIKLGEDFFKSKSLPGFLKEFSSLQEVSIYSYYEWTQESRLSLLSIPCGVRKLVLEGFGIKLACNRSI